MPAIAFLSAAALTLSSSPTAAPASVTAAMRDAVTTMDDNETRVGPALDSNPAASETPSPPSDIVDIPMRGMAAGKSEMNGMGLVPAGLMVGEPGKWMASYRYEYDRMNGNLIGTRSISDADILRQFQATPTDMKMQMHMGSLMYAPSTRLTLMAMVPYVVKAMNHVSRTGERFQEKTSGFGDIELSSLYALYNSENLRHRFLLNFGVSVPTGSINKRMMGMRLEYPMQLGSGTVGLLPGVIYLGRQAQWGWGAKLGAALPLGRNKNGYTVGNRYEASAWLTRLVTQSVSVSAGLGGESRRNVRGFDPVLDVLDEPTKDPLRQGGKRLDATLGVAFRPQGGALGGNSLFLNGDLPLSQSLDGPQLKRRFGVRLEFQREF